MARLPRVLLPVAAVLSIAVAVGCGSDEDPAKYVDEMNVTQAAVSKQFVKVQADMKPNSSAAENGRTLARFRGGITKAVTELRAMEAPGSVKDLHQDLVDQLSRYGTTIAQAEQQFASNSPQQIVAAQTALSTSVAKTAAQVNATITKINDKLH